MAAKMVTQEIHRRLRHFFPAAILMASILLCVLPSPVLAVTDQPANLQEVLVLNSYHPTFVWTAGQSDGIIDTLENSGLNLSIDVEYLDWKNYQDNTYLEDLAVIFREKYQSRPFDVIVTTDDVALDFVIEHRDDIFGNAPVVFSGLNNYASLTSAERANITGKTEEISPEKTLSSVFMLFPKTDRIYILYEDTETGQGIADRIRTAEPSYADRAEFVYVTNVTFDELAENVRIYPAGSVIISSFTRDRNGIVMDHNRVMELLTHNAQVPVFSMYDMAMGYGAMGGSILSGRHEGEIAGGMAIRILEGEPVSAIPVNTDDTTLYIFDQKQLYRFSIPDNRLPSGSMVINREPGILDKYFFEVLAAVLVIAILAICVIVLAINIRIRKKAEVALRESESRFRSLYDDNPTMYFTVDSEGKVTSVNEYGCEILGYSWKELIGRPVVNIFHDEDQGEAVKNIKKCMENISQVLQWELRKIRKDGSVIWVRETARALQIPDGKVFILIVSEDITDRKKTEESLNRATGKLNLLNQIAFEDIRNAMFSLSGYLELEKQEITNEKIQDYLSKQLDIVNSITSSLKFSQQYQNLGLKPPVWQDVQQSFLYGISHLDISSLSRTIDIDGLEIYADPMLENVFYTLAENVLLHGTGATEIAIRSEETPEGVTIFFEDNGAGIPHEKKEIIFNRRYEDKKGMGLFLSREILGVTEIMITETGEPGRGACFEIRVPKGAYRFTGEY